MVMYANDFETKEKQKLPEIKKLTATHTCQDHVLESLKMAFFVVILDSKNDSKICEAEVTLTTLINKICKTWYLFD